MIRKMVICVCLFEHFLSERFAWSFELHRVWRDGAARQTLALLLEGYPAVKKREHQIIDLLCKYGWLSIQELSDLLDVSPSSVRRDLVALDQGRFIARTHGAVSLSTIIDYAPLSIYKLPVDHQEAITIAYRAQQLIQPGDVIGISGGQICTQLALRIRHLEGTTVVTNAVNIASELTSLLGIQVRLVGGRLNPGSFELVGQAVGPSLSGVRIGKFFLGTDGLSVEHGVTAHDEAEALAARVLIEHSDATIVLADSAKFRKASFAQVAPIAAIQVVVTTNQISPNISAQFEAAGVRMIVA
jgi:DeoR/GlpR family transcriptional regulator of sugar metabolism